MTRDRPPLWAFGALAVALIAVSSSALLVRWADAGAVSLSFWRTAGGAALLAVGAVARPAHRRPAWPGRARLGAMTLAGLALAAHFATWLASLELTTVAASVTLATTTPLLIAAYLAATGHPPTASTWAAIVIAVIGAAIIAGGDIAVGGSALVGDGLAVLAAAAIGCYFLVGDRIGDTVPAVTYAATVYALAAVALLPMALLVDGGLGGYDRTTWLSIAAMILGPQLVGHTILNLLLRHLGSVTVSMALLTEAVGASVGAWLLLDEVPTTAALIGAPVVLGALAFHLRAGARDDLQTTSRRAANSR